VKQNFRLLHATETGLSSGRVGLLGSFATLPYLKSERQRVLDRKRLRSNLVSCHMGPGVSSDVMHNLAESIFKISRFLVVVLGGVEV